MKYKYIQQSQWKLLITMVYTDLTIKNKNEDRLTTQKIQTNVPQSLSRSLGTFTAHDSVKLCWGQHGT